MTYTPTPPPPRPYDLSTPPLPPPKPASHETSRHNTPLDTFPGRQLPPFPPPPPDSSSGGGGTEGGMVQGSGGYGYRGGQSHGQHHQAQGPGQTQQGPDLGGDGNDGGGAVAPPPGWDDEFWVPEMLKDKSIPDLTHLLHTPALLTSLHSSPATHHPLLPSTLTPLQTSLQTNLTLSHSLLQLEHQLHHTRSTTQSRLLSLHALERQWRAKQSDTDAALAPFSPKALYQRLVSAVAEQEQMCRALEESFLDHTGVDGGKAGERETAEFVKRFREGRKVYYLRRERKERWDEGRVGGWR